MSDENLIPLSQIISVDNIPSELNILQDGLGNIFSKLFVYNFQAYVSTFEDYTSYDFNLVSFDRIAIEIFGEDGITLVLNPGIAEVNSTEFPVYLRYSWPLLKLIENFNIEGFDFSAQAFFKIFLNIYPISDEQKLTALIVVFFPWDDIDEHAEDEEEEEDDFDYLSPTEQFVEDFNLKFAPVTPLVIDELAADNEEVIKSLVDQLNSNGNEYEINQLVFQDYILDPESDITLENLDVFFNFFGNNFSIDSLKGYLFPDIYVSIEDLNLALEFPRKWLVPVFTGDGDFQDLSLDDPLPEPYVSVLKYNVGSLEYSSKTGFLFNQVDSFELSRSMIGNTGLIIQFEGLKIDLSWDSNIPEADADGRPENFMGVYADHAVITLPKKWFSNLQENTTLQVVGRNLLIGTGGISGTVSLETIDTGNPPGEEDFFWANIGSGDGFKVGFSSFDIAFKQNKVVESRISGRLEIKKFVYPDTGDPVSIDIVGHIEDDGGFNLTASADPPYPIEFPGVFTYHMKNVGLGRDNQDSPFYIGTAGTLQFEGFLKNVLKLGPIEIQSLRIYSDGSMEFLGGGIQLLEPIVLELGPVEITVSAIHYGSHQKEVNGVMRKFNYFGFDGGLSVDPLGVEIRGDGIKYYFCTDNLPDKPSSYLHIQTIYLDLVIPESSPAAIINGWLSIPEPGVSPEYSGGVKVQIPSVSVTGSVDMKLMPRYPAFILDASLEFPAPIPLGSFAIYGFRGLFGYRYVAEKEAIGLVSGVDTWYQYYKAPPRGIHVQKFRGPNQTSQYNDPFSIGVGASLGTSFDNGTVINLRVMLLLSTPSMFMLDGRAAILSARLGLDDTKEPPFFFMASIGDNSLEFGFGADFQLPQNDGSILKLYADIQAAFFFNNSSKWYVHFGTKENPTTATIVGFVDLKSYLMLSAKGIEAGARGDINFNRTYGIIKLQAWAYIEVGGRISFERPQFGAYLDAGVGAKLDVKFVSLSASMSILFAVEAAKPFLIYGKVRIRIKIRIAFVFKFSFNAEVEVLWEKSKYVDRTAINPLTHTTDPLLIGQLVKGVNMMSNEVFELAYLGQVDIPALLHPDITKKIIPLDTYIDIKTQKGLLPGAIAQVIGGVSNPASQYTDLIPPDQFVKGKALRQVKHQYSIEELTLKFWRPASLGISEGWVDYHPYKALYPDDQTPEYNNMKIGQFQKTDGQYNTIRLLATTPFSYTEQGQPGWFIPEQYGMTVSDFFCEGEEMVPVCANFLDKPLGQRYYCFDLNHMFYSKQAAFLLLDKEDEEYAFITDHPNVFNFAQSVAFNLRNKLQILLPEPSVYVRLKLTSDSQAVRIRYYAALIDDLALEVQYGHPNPNAVNQSSSHTVIVNVNDLNQPVIYNNPAWRAISKIIIEPVSGKKELIDFTLGELTLAQNLNTQIDLGVIEWMYQDPIPLMNKLDYLTDFNGTFRERGYLFDFANNRYMDKDIQVWLPSWDVQSGGKVEGNPIGFERDGNIITIESDFQIIDTVFLPLQVPDPVVENEGFSTRITVDNLANYLTPEGYLEVNVGLYENCLNDKRLCNLHAFLDATSIHFVHPDRVDTRDLPDISVAMVRFRELMVDFDLRYADYRLMEKYAVPIGVIDEFIIRVDLPSYLDAFDAIGEIKNPIKDDGNCDCEDDRSDLEELYDNIQAILDNIFQDISDVDQFHIFIRYINLILDLLNQFDSENPNLNIINELLEQINILENFLNNPNQENLEDAVDAIQAILDYLNGIGNQNIDKLPNITMLHEVCWLSLEAYEYNLHIPEQAAISADVQATVAGLTKYIQPVWRPDTSYLLHFKVKDTVDNGTSEQEYKFTFGFTTAGPLGHFHTDEASTYGDIVLKPNEQIGGITLTELSILDDPNGKLRYYNTGAPYPPAVNDKITPHPDNWPLTSLRRYIDYERSYPNADGNLLSAKPLFYNDDQVSQIFLYFNRAYVSHFFQNWETYQDAGARAGRMKIVIKDPAENESIINPPYLDYDDEDVTTVHIPQTIEQWDTDEHPLMPFVIQQFSNLYNTDGNCVSSGGALIKPASSYTTIALKHLKPSKLYTAIVNNLYNAVGDTDFDESQETKEVHRFVFRTSRYANFSEQINSYLLHEGTGDDYVERKAIFTIEKELTAQQVDNVYKTITGVANPADSLIPDYQHAYDRIVEGILGLNPLDEAISTEFNIIRNTADSDKVVAVIIRNPEPFNIPKIPISQIADTIQVLAGAIPNSAYKVLHSKDYSQAIIMHESKAISADDISVKFRFKMWNGFAYAELGDHPPVTIELISNP